MKQREIKFRAYDKLNKKFDEHVYINSYGEIYKDLDPFGIDMSGNRKIRMTPERYEIQQFTGLKDKNGKEIYEGDILSCYDEPMGIVCFRGAGYWIGVDNNLRLSDYPNNYLEVVGNIYENPELLNP